MKVFKNKNKINERKSQDGLNQVINKKNIYSDFLAMPINFDINEEELYNIMNDTTVSACMSNRKSYSLRKDLEITCSDPLIAKKLKKIFNYELLSQALDVILYGFSVFELNWERDGFLFPSIIERNYRDFNLDADNNLIYLPDNSYVNRYKCSYLLKDKSFYKNLGKGIVSDIYWAVKFKKCSLKFWLDFQEKFGIPWIIAKSATLNKDIMANELFAMFSGDAGVFDSEDDIDIIQPSSNNVDIFSKFIEYCDNAIRERIVGGNLLGKVTSGSYASSKVQNDIRNDIVQSDLLLVLNFINDIIIKFKEVNSIDIDIDVTFKNDLLNSELAKRDKILSEIGINFSKEYIEKKYGVKNH